MRLLLWHPMIAGRSCEECRKWQWNEKTGEVELHKATGEKLPRVLPKLIPCQTDKGCPKGHWKNPKELSARNQQAYWHYKQCKAIGQFPDDPIVRRNATVIYNEEETHGRMRQFELMEYLKALATARV